MSWWLPPLARRTTVVLGVCLFGCGEPPSEPSELLTPTRQAIEEMVYGSPNPCMDDAECESGICYYGSCMGALLTDRRWMQEAIAARLEEAWGRGAEGREGIRSDMGELLSDPQQDLGRRARAVWVLEALKARDVLSSHLTPPGDPGDRLVAAVSLALTRLGEVAGVPLTAALTESDDAALSLEAVRALGRSGRPEALAPLLSMLGPTLDQMSLRAVVGALAELKDVRAAEPLVAFLGVGPEALKVPTVRTLRSLTGARLGADHAAWSAWVAAHPSPAPPPYTVRVHEAARDLGIPTP